MIWIAKFFDIQLCKSWRESSFFSYDDSDVRSRCARPNGELRGNASPDLSGRALIRAAEQNRSSGSPSDLASKLASPIANRSTRRCRRAARDGNGGAKLSLDQFLAAVPKIKYEY